ncbi:MAG: hypothetical protein D6698_13625 [Gammaproteobacteria bacterium]|nr:MAG: hypothetical protein D6698_13625 [Gammaproteobacteria bacterium]
MAGSTWAQDAFYTFTSGPSGDGFNWPASPTGLLNFDSTFPFDDFGGNNRIDNFTGNTVFFDAQYQAAGNSSLITNEAMWGNPTDISFSSIDLDFGDDFFTMVNTVAFDISLAMAGEDAPDFIEIDFFDDTENFATQTFPLTEIFNAGPAFGGFNGYAGHIHVNAADLIGFGGPLAGISGMYINLTNIAAPGGTSEFAIDNLDINGSGGSGGLDPSNSEVVLGTSNIGTNMIRNTFDAAFDFVEVENIGSGGTTYSVILDPTSDPEFVVATPATNQFIAGGQTIVNGTGTIATISQTTLSGDYQASATLINDLNGLDPDDQVTYDITIFDPPSTTDNSGSTVQVDIAPNIFITNAAAGPHAGARRASVEVTNRAVTGDGFSVTGLNIGNRADASETENATVMFDRYGRVNGMYNGFFSVSLKMADPNRSFLNGATPVSDITWNLSYNLTTISSDTVVVNNGDPLGPGVIGVNNDDTAATLIDGTSNANQTLFMAFTSDPGSNANLAGTPVDLSFSNITIDPHVFQFSYINLPINVTGSELRVLFYDPLTGLWDEAVNANNSGTPTFFAGSYDDYLSTLGGGILDPSDLGAYGVDTVNKHVWAVLDYDGVFGVGVLIPSIAGDLDGDGFVGIADLNIVLGNWNQNVTAGDPLQGDPSGDGFVGIEDLNQVLGNWNAGTPPGNNAHIPEPGVGIIGLLGITLISHSRQIS